MSEEFYLSEKVEEIAEQVIKENDELFGFIKEHDVKIGYMVSTKKKKSRGGIVHADCEKVKPKNRKFVPYDFIITVYERNCLDLDTVQWKLLMVHELLHVGARREEDGTLRTWIRPHDLQDFRMITDVYGTDWDRT